MKKRALAIFLVCCAFCFTLAAGLSCGAGALMLKPLVVGNLTTTEAVAEVMKAQAGMTLAEMTITAQAVSFTLTTGKAVPPAGAAALP